MSIQRVDIIINDQTVTDLDDMPKECVKAFGVYVADMHEEFADASDPDPKHLSLSLNTQTHHISFAVTALRDGLPDESSYLHTIGTSLSAVIPPQAFTDAILTLKADEAAMRSPKAGPTVMQATDLARRQCHDNIAGELQSFLSEGGIDISFKTARHIAGVIRGYYSHFDITPPQPTESPDGYRL